VEIVVLLIIPVLVQLADPAGWIALFVSGVAAVQRKPWWHAIAASMFVGAIVAMMVSQTRSSYGLGGAPVFRILFAYAVIGAISLGLVRLGRRLFAPRNPEAPPPPARGPDAPP
jgi:hypothetical protein